MKVAFYTLGCKVNQYETQVLAETFLKNGYEKVSCEEAADVYVVNSCTVTAMGDKKTRQMVRRFKRQNPQAVVILAGCYVQAFPEQAVHLNEADILVGANNRSSIFPHLLQFLSGHERIVDIPPHQADEPFEAMQAGRFYGRTRAYVKIEDGCDHNCAYCIIPKARGPIRSKSLSDLQTELSGLDVEQYPEVVLVGINLASYGKGEGFNLADAVELAEGFPHITRVRLGSVEPELMTRSLLERLSRSRVLCPQFHLSLQSGCDETLHRMRRRYNTDLYRKVVSNCRELFAGAAITTDIMVGFPGETQEEFLKTCAFVEEIGFEQVHVFRYSVRPGTPAAQMDNQVSAEIKEERAQILSQVVQKSRLRFLESQQGRIEEVLFEQKDLQSGCFVGHTKNYIPVYLSTTQDLAGKCMSIALGAPFLEGVRGEEIWF